MSEKWTQGPWDATPMYCEQKTIGVYCDDATGSIVAQVGGFRFAPRPYGEIEANAHLIAAAPDMYEALMNAVYDFSELLEWIKVENAPLRDIERRSIAKRLTECRAALTKARGEA